MRVPMSAFVKKSCPKRYKSRDAPYAVGGRGGICISSRPRPYPTTRQQAKVRDVAEQCGIRAGISKGTLMTQMRDCVGPKMRRGG